MRRPNYDKFPAINIANSERAAVRGWAAIVDRLRRAVRDRSSTRTIVCIECYTGVDEQQIIDELRIALKPDLLIESRNAMRSPAQIDERVAPFLGGSDPVFGYLTNLKLADFFDGDRLASIRQEIHRCENGVILVVGVGAILLAKPDLLVYADLPRWEAQLRFRRNESSNLGVENRNVPAGMQYKCAFFVDWRVCDRWKKPLLGRCEFLLDTTDRRDPKLVEGDSFRAALRHVVTRPFRVVPFFDPGPWGGQWMKEICDLDRSAPNYAWCFDCVPEENSLLLGFGDFRVEVPAIDLVFDQPRALLGEAVHGRFGDEFPIRFDFLDTMGGGNLSLQVHPLTEYIQSEFGMHYTQDESYYLLDAGPSACVYLGLKDDVDRQQMATDLRAAQEGGPAFPADRYANRWPAKKHDHFLIPAGTLHCSGANSMVLEISATPYIFTFKLWDWNRLGLDGKPRPIHIDHGLANIQWDRTTDWVRKNLVNTVSTIAQGEGWREERTGLHEREFIETRRHWFTGAVPHHTKGGVNVLNLIEGEEAIVESPRGAFEPFVVHYAETFIVPAAVGEYTIRPHGASRGEQCATIKAFVRT